MTCPVRQLVFHACFFFIPLSSVCTLEFWRWEKLHNQFEAKELREVWPVVLATFFFFLRQDHITMQPWLAWACYVNQAGFELSLVCPLTCGSSSPLYYLLLLWRWNRHAHPESQPGLSLGWSLGPFLLLAAKTKSTNGEKFWKKTAPDEKPGSGSGSVWPKTVKALTADKDESLGGQLL